MGGTWKYVLSNLDKHLRAPGIPLGQVGGEGGGGSEADSIPDLKILTCQI